MFKLVLWLAAPASVILSSCEPSVPSHCTHLDEQCSYMYWKLLTLVSTHPCLHMRNYVPKSCQDYNHLQKISLLDIIWLEVGQGFLHLLGPCQSKDGRVKLSWFVRETRKGHQCSCSHPQKLRACCRATEGRLLIYCHFRWISSFEFSFRPLMLLAGIFVSKLGSSMVLHWYDNCILANGNRSGSWTNILTLAKW